MSDDILHELKADWMECACYEGSLSVDRELIDQAAAEIERLRAQKEALHVCVAMIERAAAGAIYSQEMIHAMALGALKILEAKP